MLLLLGGDIAPVSYTHLDVYKRQGWPRIIIALFLLSMYVVSPFIGINLKSALGDTLVRFGMNAILVLSLVPMIQSGTGLNFGMPLGVEAGLLGAVISIEIGLSGFAGFIGAIIISIPVSYTHLEYTEEEINELEKAIDISRDMLYDYAGANMFTNRYLLKFKGNIYELPQEVFMCIAMLLAINEEDRVAVAKKFYNALSLKKISLATPILANLRIPKGNLSSCFITAMDDNIESIFYNIDTIAKISKSGGGVGLNISRIRAKDSMVNGYYNASGGVVPWVKIVNDTAVAVNQQGRRAGAVTAALDSWHLDIELFLELQTENGDQRGKAYDIYPQVVLSDLFMKRVEDNLEWTLVCLLYTSSIF